MAFFIYDHDSAGRTITNRAVAHMNNAGKILFNSVELNLLKGIKILAVLKRLSGRWPRATLPT